MNAYIEWLDNLERNFKPNSGVKFAQDFWYVAIIIVSAYLLVCYYGQRYMKTKAPLTLQYTLALWNAFLSIFSFLGMIKTVPALLRNISLSFEVSICESAPIAYGSGPSGLWVFLFIYSKVPELVDTVFIVLRKKPLIFLHWYHHVTVLLYCWHAYATMAATGLYFVAMNYTVHFIMYAYYALSVLHIVPKWFPTWTITLAQIAQMIVGTAVCISSWYYQIIGVKCHNEPTNMILGALMYASYLVLFVQFAIGRFIVQKPKESKKEL